MLITEILNEMISSSDLKKIYEKSPYGLKKLSGRFFQWLSPNILYGKSFRYWTNILEDSQWWNKEKHEDYQIKHLYNIIDYAYKNVPYYKKTFDEIDFKPKDLKDFGDIKKIPFLTKKIVRENFNDLISNSFPRSKMVSCQTGGTSGRRFKCLEPSVLSIMERAFILTLWKRVGYEPSEIRIALGDVPISNREKGRLWEFDPLKREWRFSGFDLTDDNIRKYIEKFKKIKCYYLHGFVSSLTILAKYILDNNISDLPKFRAIFPSSEPLYSWQRELLEKAFKAKVYNWYGQTEKVILAGECEVTQKYHIFPEYGYAEVVRPDGSHITSENEIGELVGTGFYNYAMPFIRYRLDDWGQIIEGDCNCGRNYKYLTKLEAKRIVNMIVSKQNHLISTLAIYFRGGILDNVENFQFYQDKKGELLMNIVKGKKYSSNDTNRICAELNSQIGKHVDINIRFVDRIPLTRRGKQKILEQRLT